MRIEIYIDNMINDIKEATIKLSKNATINNISSPALELDKKEQIPV